MLSAAIAAATTLAACEGSESFGFSLPAGDEEAGRRTFVEMACPDCHAVAAVEELRAGVEPSMTVPLGGPTSRVRTYGELVTSIVNPSHRISEAYQAEPFAVDGASQMRNYNQVMTVQQLIDVVTFLQLQYELVEYPATEYSQFHYP